MPTSTRRILLIGFGVTVLSACMSSAPRPVEQARSTDAVAGASKEVESEAVVDTRATARDGVTDEAAAGSDVAFDDGDESGVPEPSALDQVLAERRRGDYPEVEFVDSGFTITEQVRIGNAARSSYERATELLQSDRTGEGIAVLQEIIESTPDATAPYIDLGMAFSRLGDMDQAEQAFSSAVLLSPDNPVVHNELGIVYRKTGRFQEARASYEKALEVFQDFHFARRNLAVLCDLYLADFDCALQNYRSYLASVDADAEVEIWIADIQNRLGP